MVCLLFYIFAGKFENRNMKKIVSIVATLLCILTITGCKKELIVPQNNDSKPYFYVRYYGNHWATVKFDKFSTMTITDKNGEEVSYEIGSREVIVGPVYAGFTAKMTISAPYDGGNNGSISISRNSDHIFGSTYASFANSKQEETLTYTISDMTGL